MQEELDARYKEMKKEHAEKATDNDLVGFTFIVQGVIGRPEADCLLIRSPDGTIMPFRFWHNHTIEDQFIPFKCGTISIDKIRELYEHLGQELAKLS